MFKNTQFVSFCEPELKPSCIVDFSNVGTSKQSITVRVSFTDLAIQNTQLNAQLLEKNEYLEERIKQLQEQFEIVVQELYEQKEKERLIQEKKEKRKNRKGLPKRQPITPETYKFLIENSEKLSYAKSYRGSRLRLALALLLVTGIWVGELLPLKMEQVQTLFVDHWIAIDQAKRGPSNYKAFLTWQGAMIMRERISDFEFMWHFKDENSYIFTAKNSNKPLERKTFTNLINQFIKDCAKKIGISSHSFRIGFIKQLWRYTNDIEFVRQAIGHAKIDTTSLYVEHMPDKEWKRRMQNISSSKDLVIDLNNQKENENENKSSLARYFSIFKLDEEFWLINFSLERIKNQKSIKSLIFF